MTGSPPDGASGRPNLKVALVSSLYRPLEVGGAERAVGYLVDWLPGLGCTPVVLTLTEPDGRLEEEHAGGGTVYRIPIRNAYLPKGGLEARPSAWRRALWHARDRFNPDMGRVVADILRRERPDLVHTHNIGGFSVSVWASAAAEGIPVVHTIQDYGLVCPRATMTRGDRNCRRQCRLCGVFSRAKRQWSGAVAAVVGASRFVLDTYLAHGFFPGARRLVIHNPAERRPAEPPRGAAGNGTRLGFLGRLVPTKGVELLLDAVSRLAREASISLTIGGVGSPSYTALLNRKAEGLPVTFLGYVRPEVLFGRVDVLVIPSLWHEPLPLVALEAFAHGLPVIASRRGGLPEVVEEGVTGELFDPDDVDSLVQAIRRVAGDPHRRRLMGQRAYERAARNSVDVWTARYVSVYREVTGTKG